MAAVMDPLLRLFPKVQQQGKNRTKHDLAGYGTVLAVCKFMAWAHEQDRFPSPEAVMNRFGVCRATAYRWTLALAETYGLDTARRHGGRHPRSDA